MNRSFRFAVLSALTLGSTVFVTAAHADQAPGRLVLVQAVPGQALTVSIDGRTVDEGSHEGAVLGPYPVSPGGHLVSFSDRTGALNVSSTVSVASGASKDVVVHRPAQVGGTPVVNYYPTPMAPIGPGKARVLIAHTATVAPADVRVDGKVVFRDIANGEYATADLPAGPHTAALLPTGLTSHPILGPLALDLKPGTVTMVYAVGDPKTDSMKVILHSAVLSVDGSASPSTIDTGRAGLAAGVHVSTFAVPRSAVAPGAGHRGGAGLPVLPIGAAFLVFLGSGYALSRRSRRASVVSPPV
jgi:hypothetical protein